MLNIKRECSHLTNKLNTKTEIKMNLEKENNSKSNNQTDIRKQFQQTLSILENLSGYRIIDSSDERNIFVELLNSECGKSKENCKINLKLTENGLGEINVVPKEMMIHFKEIINYSKEINDIRFLLSEMKNIVEIQKKRNIEISTFSKSYEVQQVQHNLIKVIFNKIVSCTIEMDEDYPNAMSNVRITSLKKKEANVTDKFNSFKKNNPIEYGSIKELLESVKKNLNKN